MAATGIVGGDPNRVSKAGDTMTGALVLPGDPVASLQASDKHYVDTTEATISAAVTAETTRATTAEATKLTASNNLSDLASATTARTNLGLGSAATQNSSAFDAAGTSAAETTRAQAAESTNSTAISTETTRAQAAEVLLYPKSGGGINGVAYINATPGAGGIGSFPVGFANSTAQTGIALLSSYPSDDVLGGTDGTSRISLYSYQRANANSFGEVVRAFGMRKDAKMMLAWYAPKSGYDGTTRNPTGSSWTPVTWIGSHWESNGHTGNHKHWEIEIPDVNGALQGRFEVLFGNQADETIGLDKTNILTNLTDFTIRCYGQSTTTNADQKQRLILNAVAGHDREINWSVTTDSTGQRWAMMADGTAESGSNAGTNFVLTRYSDSGTSLGTPLWIQRSDGQTTFGAAAAKGAKVASVWGTSGQHGFSAQPTSSPGTGAAFHTVLSVATDRAMATVIGSQPATIFVQYADGKHEWGDGTNTRDTNLYRGGAGLLQTDSTLVVGTAGAIKFGTAADTDLYRLAANSLATDGALTVFGALTLGSTPIFAPLFAKKASDQVVNANATLANDNDLAVALAANATYIVECVVIYDSSTAADIQFAWTGPTGTTFDWTNNGISTGAAGGTSSITVTRSPIGSGNPLPAGGVGVGSKLFAQIRGIVVTSSTTGNLQLMWAQNTSDATNTTVRINSFLRLTRVA